MNDHVLWIFQVYTIVSCLLAWSFRVQFILTRRMIKCYVICSNAYGSRGSVIILLGFCYFFLFVATCRRFPAACTLFTVDQPAAQRRYNGETCRWFRCISPNPRDDRIPSDANIIRWAPLDTTERYATRPFRYFRLLIHITPIRKSLESKYVI